MRNFIVSLVCLSIMLSAWYVFSCYSDKMSSALQDQSQELITESINKGNWISAEEDFRELTDLWKSYKKTASIFMDSKDINEIDCTLDKAHLYIMAEDISNSSGEISYLKDKFKFLHKNDIISLENIL